MATKSRETIYGASIRASAERAKAAPKEADQLACIACNQRLLETRPPAHPASTPRLVPGRTPVCAQPPADAGSVSGLPCPGRPQRRSRPRADHDALGHAATAAQRRAAGHQYPQHRVATLAGLAEAGKPVP